MIAERQAESIDMQDKTISEFSSSDTAIYISELAQELEVMAKQSNLKMVGYLLAMVAREASQEGFPIESFTVTTHQ